ncbi:phage tail length tape measure family protein [Mesorhizobium neociceri]|uniref:Bacteriophage tail tape measure N-terminal domain-containing protein n=1 Tax=Mesorhizobium neociceri TaxID=1307853 RepID=A0A838B4I4_9HYPH|nr:hypothetical protein [Mesorhizobium neociceri]MBA1141758.1 hypothetical protein [Mesorhizobium neociceri]
MSDIALSSLRVGADFDASRYAAGAAQKVASDKAMIASSQATAAAFSQADTKISSAGDSLAKLSRQYIDGFKNQERFEQGLRQLGRQIDSGKTDMEGATRILVGMNQKLGLSADASELAAKGQTQLAAAVGMANAQIDGQAVSLAQAAATAAAQAERLETIRQKYDQTYASGQRMSSELAELAELERSGAQITGGYASALDNLVLKYDQTAAAAATAATAHKQFIAAARADQAAENSRQVAAANQGSFNSVLGVAAPTSGARASASVFEADFAQMEEVSRQKAQQAGQAFATNLENSLVAGTAKSARDAAAVFSADFAQIEEIASLKAQQAGQAFGTELDSSLVAGIAKSARDAASVFTAEMDRLDTIAKLKAEQIGSTFQSDLNASFGIGSSGGSARASASVFEDAGRESDQMASRVAALRAELDPAAAAQNRLNDELSEYSALAAKGAISAEELVAAQTLARSRVAANQNGAGNRLSSFQVQGLGYQANDVVTMALLGAPVGQIAASQGGQILQTLQMGEGGIAGSLSAIKGSAAAAGTALVGTLGTVGLIATGFGVAAVAAGAFYLLTRDRAKSLNDALKDQKQDILEVASAYDLAKVSADNYNKSRGIYAGAAARKGQTDLGTAARSEDIDVLDDLARFVVPGYHKAGFYQARSQYSAFNDPISAFSKNFDYDELAKGVRDITAQNPALQETGDKILNIAKAGHEAAAAFKEGADALARINARAPSLADARLGQDYRDQNDAQLTWLERQQSAAFAGIGAKSPEERRQAAMASEAAKPSAEGESADVRQFKIASAGAMAYKEALHQLTEAQDQRRRSLEQTLDSAKLDVELIGKTTAATEGLRLAFQLEQEVREAAAQSNTKVDEAEIARIRAKAAEYGKLKALQEARDTIHVQEIDLETQRAEVSTIGENTLARQRAAAALKAEQDIRKLGIPLYGEEANQIRANTAALSDQAEAMAKASLQTDLLFERSQILRNEQDQQIASRLQSAGLPVDLNSVEAGMMRYNMALSEAKDNFKGFFTDMAQGLKEGKSLWESFKDAGINALSKLADKLIDRGLDGIFNSLFGGQSAGGGLLGDLLSGNSESQSQSAGGASSFLGKLFGGAGGQSVGSMQVQAASVFINGSPVGGLGAIGSLLDGQSGTPFQADSDLMDVLGRPGAANQNYIQTRIDQAFGTGGSAQDLIQSRIDQAFGGGGLGGIFSPSGGFSGGGGLTGSMSSYASAIKMIESAGSGGYSALGPMLKNGNQALGAYQVMKSNLPSWSTEAFGSPMSPKAFLGNPSAQDAVFEQQFGKLLSKYGNSNDAASAWFTGGPLAKNGGASDILGTTGSQYVDKFNAALSKLGGVTDHTTSSIGSLGSGTTSLLSSIGGAANDATKGLGTFSSALSQFPSAPAAPGGGGGGLFGWLGGLFGGGGGGIGSFSPGVQADFASGALGLGLFADGTENAPAGWSWVGERGPELRKLRAGDVIRSNPRSMQMAGNQGGAPAANDSRPSQNIHQTVNFIFRENPATPASQNQIATKSARALEKLQRTA